MASKQESVFEAPESKDDDGAQIKKFLGLIRQASNAALITLIVDSIANELTLKPHRIQLIKDFLTRELPKSESDFTILRVSELLTRVLVIFQGHSRKIADYLVNRYNVAAGVSSESQALLDSKSQSRALEKFNKSFLAIPLQPYATQERDQNQEIYFKSLSVSALMQSALIEQDVATAMTKLSASEFFDRLIRAYQPLLADSRDEQPKSTKHDQPQKMTKEEKKSATRKGIKSMVMGQLKDVSSIKLSDFIDEKFLEELDDVDEVVHDGRQKQPLQNLVNELLQNSQSELIKPLTGHKRVRTEAGSSQHAAILCSPLLAFVIELTNRMLSLEWRKRQAAASQLRAVINYVAQEAAKKGGVPDLEYYVVAIKDNGFLSVQSTHTLPFASLIKNLLPRLLIFILKDNFSDFEGLKVLAPAREEAILLLADIQYYSQLPVEQGGFPELVQDLRNLLNLLPTIFISVENDNWYSRQNFFLLIKAMTLRNPPGSKTNEVVLRMFSSLLVMSLPSVEDEPKVVITEIMQALLPVFLAGKDQSGDFQDAQNTICQLIYNLTLNLQRSDEIEASSISVFQLVCKVFEMREQYRCLADMQFGLDLATYFPFNFHKIEAVRYAYNQLISLYLAQPNTAIQVQDLRVLHTLVVQSLAMETSKRLVKLLLKVLAQIVTKFENERDVYLQYLQEDLMTEPKLLAWIYDVSVQFDSFIFFESKQFESVENDYFKIVFRPSNTVEWEEFYMQKTENLTSAIAVMLAHCRDAAGFIFDQLCAKTMAYDEDPQSGALIPRTLLNQSMMHLMLSLEKYLRIIAKRAQPLVPNQDGVLDLCYIAELSSQFLHALEKDVNVGECWQIDQMFASLHQFEDLCLKRAQLGYQEYNTLSQQCAVVSGLLQQLCQLQSFVFEQEFRTEIEKLATWTMQTNDQQVISLFLPFQSNYHNLCFFALEYTSRLKSVSASILLSLAKISVLQERWKMEGVFRLEPDFIAQSANPIVKSLLAQVNQERNYTLKKQSVKAVADLIFVGQHFKFDTLCKKTLRVLFDMVQSEDGEINAQLQTLINDRYRALAYFFKLLIKQTTKHTIYEMLNGFIGALVLRPPWTASKMMAEDTLKQLKRWLSTLKLLLSVIEEHVHKAPSKVSETLQLRYVTLAQQEVCSLLARAFSLALPAEHQRLYLKQLPEVFDLIFPRLTGKQRKEMILVLVTQLEQKQWIAFECLNKLLDTQTSRQTTSVEFMEYLPVFVIPVIQAIQNQHEIYQPGEHIVMRLLAKVIQLLPLNIASMQTSKEAKKGEEIDSRIRQGIDFLKVFANNQIVEDYEIVVPFKASLRQYQKEGINWMAQLGKYNLNCALCDDMGLGKTLQSLLLIFNESCKTGKRQTSLVVCPTSLTYNWLAEVDKFFTGFKAVVVDGSQQQRDSILKNVESYDLIIVNYEKLKGCMNLLKDKQFFYTVLDEAHKIKNSKSVIAQTVKQIKASRKLALSGTPLQNRVSDLWSLFDFLMPGFLEDEPTFNKMYNKYLTANIKKMQEKLEDTQAFITALQSLKKRIAPFILRRTKEQVLKELPPKVIQDYPCRMTPVQASAHLQVEKNYPFQQVLTSLADKKQKTAGASILKNLILHRKVCNHPILLKDELNLSKIDDTYCQSGKMVGLVELLVESEILSAAAVNNETVDDSKNVSNDILGTIADVFGNTNQPIQQAEPHRALIFCQMSSFMQLIIEQVLVRFGVKHLQLLGSQSSFERVQTVNTFNSDPSYRVLILTTSVGGLGLTLTGADVVIFAEHDWNPMKDLQAMDRAHRIGQTRTVNVYRLILHDTLEEKIMSLQKFKENLAKSLIHARGDAISTDQVQNLEMADLLKSFEEHTSYQATTGDVTAAGRMLPAKKTAKEAGVMAKLTGLPGVPADMLVKASDDYNANLDSIWQSADVEKY